MKAKTGWMVCLAALLAAPGVFGAPEAFETGPHNVDQLPGGKEADGIMGDFILRNGLVEAVISCDKPLRKANMGTMWGAVTPGCLYDLTLRGEDNDQLTCFLPSNQQGPVSYVRIAGDGSDGTASVEAVVTAANNGGIYKRHTYTLEDGWQGLAIRTLFRNEGDEAAEISVKDYWKPMQRVDTAMGITFGDSVDPADKVGYAYAFFDYDGAEIPEGDTVRLAPGDEITLLRGFSAGRSPAEAFGLLASLKKDCGTVSGRVVDSNGDPAVSASVIFTVDGVPVTAYPGDEGTFEVRLPAGDYDVRVADLGRPDAMKTITVRAGSETELNVEVQPASKFVFDIRKEDGGSSPCKAQFHGVNGTETPVLGPTNRAHGCMEQYHSETGQFEVRVPPGTYRVVVTRGIEFGHIEKEIELGVGEAHKIEGTLKRLVDTAGWVSTDFHNHSTPSGDNQCGTYDRVINLGAEHIEFAPTTEHNRLYDWQPYIDELGLSEEIATIVGIELTGPNQHFNAFPYVAYPHEQDGGAPVWQEDPRLNAIVLRDFQGSMPERWVQINHPDMVKAFIDRDGDGMKDGGYAGLERLIDGAETWWPRTRHGNILAKAPFYIEETDDGNEVVRFQRQFIWLQLLNLGHRYTTVCVSDAHHVWGNGVGSWRGYVPSSTDKPAEIDWREIVHNAKAGRVIITNGPFLTVETSDGILPGGSARGMGSVDLKVKVQCTDWIDIDRVQILVNGRQREDLNFTRETHPEWFSDGVVKFDRMVTVPLSEDSHIIAAVYGENFNLGTGYGESWQSDMNPCAYNHPIFVDVDGGGFEPNGDTLGYPLPTAGITADEARALMQPNM